ncbi:MAG: hypothetical protein E6K13_05315 [Methanobacteriota archaeon]|nr:MAG: hypothetical protein E6K13_05315 [Euryarchaeota archaeon]
MGSPKCPVCSASVRTENLSKHLQSVHPREAKPEMVLEAERKATQTVRPPPPRSFSASLPRNVIIVVLILALLAGGAWVVATSPAYSPYNANTPVLQMCMQESPGFARHDHVLLSITITGVPQQVPMNIGVAPGCMRPVHTHDTTGRIHVESSVAHEFTLADFFAVWNQPFSKERILGYTTDTSHTIVFRVDGLQNTQFEQWPFPHNTNPDDPPKVAISYETR